MFGYKVVLETTSELEGGDDLWPAKIAYVAWGTSLAMLPHNS